MFHLKIFIAAIFSFSLFTCPGVKAQDYSKSPFTQEKWLKPYQPFCIAGNLYYVGTADLCSYLITTPKGHILINTGLVETVPQLKANIEALGFKVADIKILLTNQVHFDHVGGMAEIKRISGAQLMVDEKDAGVMADGGSSDYFYGDKIKDGMFEPIKPDRILHDRDKIQLGGMTLTMLHHPGHTKGSCSFLFWVKDETQSYQVLITNVPTVLDGVTPGMPTYPDVVKDYELALRDLKKQRPGIWFAAHSSQFNFDNKHKPGDPYNPMAFADRQGYEAMLKKVAADIEKLKANHDSVD